MNDAADRLSTVEGGRSVNDYELGSETREAAEGLCSLFGDGGAGTTSIVTAERESPEVVANQEHCYVDKVCVLLL